MSNEYVNCDVCQSLRSAMKEQSERDRARADKHSDSIDKLTSSSIKLTEIVKRQSELLNELDGRIDKLEMRPARNWELAISALLSAVMSTAVSAAVSYLFIR